MDFYITLPCGPTKTFAFNTSTLSRYCLDDSIKLDGGYEVALVQSIFQDCHPTSLGTIKMSHVMDPNYEISVDIYAKDGESYKTIIKKVNRNLKEAYTNIRDSDKLKELNQLFVNDYKDDSLPRVELFEKNEFFLHRPEGWEIEIEHSDKNYMNYPTNDFKLIGRFHSEKFKLNRHFYVTLNILQDQIFAERKYPLLSSFVLDEIKSNIVSKEFHNPRYIKIKDKEIKELEIEYSENIDAQLELGGNITSVLHFRRINGL